MFVFLDSENKIYTIIAGCDEIPDGLDGYKAIKLPDDFKYSTPVQDFKIECSDVETPEEPPDDLGDEEYAVNPCQEVLYDRYTPKPGDPNPLTLVTLDEAKKYLVQALDLDNQKWVYKHYDDGEQKSINAIHQMAMKRQKQDVMDKIQGVWDWISMNLNYYYNIKAQILNAASVDELLQITWDYTQNEEPEGTHVTLSELMAMLNS